MPKQKLWIGGSKNLQPGDVVVGWSDSMSMLDKTLQVEREVPDKPFVPDPEVWRECALVEATDARKAIWVNDGSRLGGSKQWTTYVRKDED